MGSISWMFQSPQGRVYSEHRVAPSLREHSGISVRPDLDVDEFRSNAVFYAQIFCIIASIITAPMVLAAQMCARVKK